MIEQKPISLESEAGFRVLFECATISILVVSESGIIELANPCAAKLFDYGAKELVGKSVEILIPEGLRHKHKHHREQYFTKPKDRPMGLGMELHACKKDGTIFPVEISLGHYQLEGEKLAVAFVTDITDSVEAKQLASEREAWFRNMADYAPVMIWVAGPDKQCSYFNNTWLEFTGRDIEQEIGTGWLEAVHPEDKARCLNTFYQAFEERKGFMMEYRLKRHDGQYRWIRDVGKPSYSAASLFTGYIGSASDIHDQRTLHEELELMVKHRTTELYDALSREKEMNELKSRFVSMASHEFRTPLSVIFSSTSLVDQYLGDGADPRIEKHLLRIKSSVNTLTSILNDFLSLDRLEQGNEEVEKEVFDIREFIREVVDQVGLISKKGQLLHADHEGDPLVMLDMKKLRYIMVNLISNAMKYSLENTDIHISSKNADGYIVLKVKDDGIGIPEEEQGNMYKKFFRAKNATHIQGTGLGLTIVKQYVELMNGNISFESQPGNGTTFTVKILQKS